MTESPPADPTFFRRAWSITLVIAIGLLTLVLVLIGTRVQEDWRNRLKEHHATARSHARLLASQSARLLEAMDLLSVLTIEDLTYHRPVNFLDSPVVGAEILDHARHLPGPALLAMIDAQGRTVMSTDAMGIPHPAPMPADLLKRHREEGIAFLTSRQVGPDRQGYLVISRSVIDTKGDYRGVVAVAIAEKALEPIFHSFAETGISQIAIIDEEGQIMLSWPPSAPSVRQITDLPVFADLVLGNILHSGTLTLDNDDSIIGASQIPAFPLRSLVATSLTATSSAWTRRARQTAGVTLIACLLVGWGLMSLYGLERQRQALEAGLRTKTAELADANRNLEQAVKDVTRLSRTDALTKLWNRRYLAERLIEEIARAERLDTNLTVMMFDLDHFKRVNDTHGHPMGDKVLTTTAAILRRVVRRTDLLARYGGEEFLALMPATDADAAHSLADRLRETVASENFTAPNGDIFRVTCSVGLAQWYPGDDADRLIDRADRALYAAKQAGRNRTMRG